MSNFVQPSMFDEDPDRHDDGLRDQEVGVPKNRAKASAFRPNQSPPKTESRWAWGR